MKFQNPNYRKIKKSFHMMVTCGYCKMDLVSYQKIGKGNLLRLWLDRVIESEIDLFSDKARLVCPRCGHELGNRFVNDQDKVAFKIGRGLVNTRRID